MTTLYCLNVLYNVLVIKLFHQINLIDDRLSKILFQSNQWDHLDRHDFTCLSVQAFINATKSAPSHNFLQLIFTNILWLFI